MVYWRPAKKIMTTAHVLTQVSSPTASSTNSNYHKAGILFKTSSSQIVHRANQQFHRIAQRKAITLVGRVKQIATPSSWGVLISAMSEVMLNISRV